MEDKQGPDRETLTRWKDLETHPRRMDGAASLTLPQDMKDMALAAAAAEGVSFSRWMRDAIVRKLTTDGLENWRKG